MIKPLLSIIIPVYNNEKYISNAIESVLVQAKNNVEIIIIDDGSTDGTPEIVDEYEKRYSNIRVIHQSNQWIYASFNRGIAEARGMYIYILNSDDKLAENSLDAIESAIKEYDYPDVVWTKVFVCKCDEKQNILEKKDARPKITTTCYWCEGMDNKAWELLITSDLMMAQVTYRAEFIKQFKFRNDVYAADQLFNIEIAKKLQSFVIIPNEIYMFFIYNIPGMNASSARYYGYEHQMYNEIYLKGIELASIRGVLTDAVQSFITNRRKSYFSSELKSSLLYSKCQNSEKIKYVLENAIDDFILTIFDDREELEARIFSALRYYFVSAVDNDFGEYQFVYDMLEALLRYEKDETDYITIEAGVFNSKNPYNIGLSFLNKITSK